jgi:FkbM family methyltransferase
VPRAFADNNPQRWGDRVQGLPILEPAEAVRRFGSTHLFVATVYNGSNARQQLRSMGCRWVAPFGWLYWHYSERLIPFLAMDRPSVFLAERQQVGQAFDLWADDESRREYVAQLRFHAYLDLECTRSHLPPSQTYFPQDLVPVRPDEVFVDVGAFDGDSIRSFLERQGGRFARILGIEPDPLSFARLRAYVSTLPPVLRDKIGLFPVAVSSSGGTLQFEAAGTPQSSWADSGTTVECTTLDEVLAGVAPTYIKMDIEGAEPEALRGARRSIQRSRPVLAVCLYHHQTHLWKIPLLLQSLCPDYRLYLRRYAEECWELVCYAIAPDRGPFRTVR